MNKIFCIKFYTNESSYNFKCKYTLVLKNILLNYFKIQNNIGKILLLSK